MASLQAPSSAGLNLIYFEFDLKSSGENDMRSLVLSIVLFVVCPAFGQQPKEITNSIGMKLVLIHAGTFTMGSDEKPEGLLTKPPHEVTISKPYYLGAYEVTQDEYEKVMGNNPSRFKGAKNPVEKVGWDDAVSFCKKLSEMPKEKAAGREYRLPTEAEWEYACRASSETAYSFGDSADSLGDDKAQSTLQPVGGKKPNRWGLYDMHGNVWEWCADWYGDYPSVAATDPQGPIQGSQRVLRGGSWYPPAYCRSADRLAKEPSYREAPNGFRLALSPPVKQPEAANESK